MSDLKALPDDLLSKVSGAGDELNDQDKETLRAIGILMKSSGLDWNAALELFQKQYPGSWKTFTDYLEGVWDSLPNNA